MQNTRKATVFIVSLLASLVTEGALGQSTAFTYQGRLEESGIPANGAYDFCFRLFNDLLAGEQIGEPLCATSVEVVNGLFTIDLNFGQQYATPEDRYLEIEVCGSNCTATAGNAPLGSGFFTLQPRQRINSAPRAAHANSAFALDSPSGVHSNAVFVDSAGRVGIGTTAPTKKLHVVGPLIVDSVGDQAEALVLGIERDWVFRQQGSGAGTALKLQSVGGGGNKNFIIETTGFVGIGTTSPAAILHARGLAPAMILQDTASAGNQAGYVSFRNNTGSETAWAGFGLAGSPDFSIINARSGGDIVLHPFSGDVVVNATLDIGIEDIQSPTVSGTQASLACPAGKRALSGGCWCGAANIQESRHSGSGWFCRCSGQTFGDERVIVYVRCARVK